MTDARQPRARCSHCDEIIGVYEPMIVVFEDTPRFTSLVAESHLGLAEHDLYHHGCFPGGPVPGSEERE